MPRNKLRVKMNQTICCFIAYIFFSYLTFPYCYILFFISLSLFFVYMSFFLFLLCCLICFSFSFILYFTFLSTFLWKCINWSSFPCRISSDKIGGIIFCLLSNAEDITIQKTSVPTLKPVCFYCVHKAELRTICC